MKEYLENRKKRERQSTVTGILLTVILHACAAAFISFSGLNYIYPPPEDRSFILDVEEIEVPEVKKVVARAPESRKVDLEKPVEMVQKSESPYEASEQNLTTETRQDNFGDVETEAPQPKEEPKLDPRASFPGMAKKDTSLTSPHSADEESNVFKAGQTNGNVTSGNTDNRPNAHLEGRSVNKASLRKPYYNVQESGIVVVSIWVNQYGTVEKAIPGAKGTTVDNKTLWNEARNAAMEAKFEQKADAPAMQEGTITYIFKLK